MERIEYRVGLSGGAVDDLLMRTHFIDKTVLFTAIWRCAYG